MPSKMFTLLPFVGITLLALQAQATTVNLTLSGSGISGNVALTYTPQVGGADSITAISGTFSDTNAGLNGKPSIVNESITGLYAINPISPLPTGVYATNFSQFSIANGVPSPPASDPSTSLSYDNTYYPAGSPIVCDGYPASGGVLDVYGVLFTISNGDVVDLWSNGTFGSPAPVTYGAAVADATNTYDYVGGLNLAPVPEPTTAALFGLSLAGLALMLRRRTKTAPSAT